MNNIWILAQTEANEAPSRITSEGVTNEQTSTKVATDANTPVTRPKGPLGDYGQFIIIILIFAMMYFILFRGPRKKEQEHRKMVQSLEKNDKVRTIGGIIGTIVDINDDIITLKVDESNNTKIKVVASAIGKNLSKEK